MLSMHGQLWSNAILSFSFLLHLLHFRIHLLVT